MTFFEAMFDFIKSVAWPLVVGGFAYYFRDEIRGLFKRVQRVGLDGAQFEASAAQIPAPAQQTIDTSNLQDVGLPRTEFMASVERKLLVDVNIVAPDKQIALVVRHLAQARIELAGR